MEKFALWWSMVLALILACTAVQAQQGIVTHNDFTAQTLVKDIFASGACDNIDLITPIGHENGLGYFENGMDIIGLDRGIILSTGPTHNAAGPNNETDKSGDLPGNGDDEDLSRLSTGQVRDAVGIEFDFVPLDSIVRFRYVFASEEYCEFVGSNYNDVFGFFISGPGMEGEFTADAENVALIPGTDDFVAINSVNFNQNAGFYIHNERPEDQSECGLSNISTPHLSQIQYDGFTTVLTAELRLQPCQTYHIRLVVGDVADAFFDSAVFLEAGSFNLGGEIAVTAIGETAGPGQVFEGCEDAAFRFSRNTDSPIDRPLIVDYQISAASTATPGLDYTPFSGTITIPEGDLYVDLPVNTLPDMEMEDEELIRLVLNIPCACYADSADLVIVPAPELSLNLSDVYTCPGEATTMVALPSGGVTPYSFQWQGGGNTASQQVPGVDGATHTVSVTDACQQEVSSTASVFLTTPPSAFLSGAAQICIGDTAWLPLQLEGVPPYSIGYLHAGEAFWQVLEDTNSALPLTLPGTYQLIGIQDAACTGTATGTGQVEVWNLDAAATVFPVNCANGNDGAIQLEMTAGSPPFDFHWLHDEQAAEQLTNLAASTYELEVTDARGCSRLFSWDVTAPPPLVAPQVDCEQLFTGTLYANASGGTPPYDYQLDGGSWQNETTWLDGLWPGEAYPLTIQDANGCELQTEWIMPALYAGGMASLDNPIKLPLGITAPIAWELYVPENLLASIDWQPAVQLSCVDCLDPEITARQSGTVELYLKDIFGCSQQLQAELIVEDRVDVFLPNAFSPNGDEHNDQWFLFGNTLQVERIEELLIFDRWGNMVFQATDWPINSERHGWDGTFRGQPLDPGVYAYSIRFRLVNGERRTLGGDVLLLR
ncbi:choice-of-anchor L domain-containing protein [Lewinella sp. LCG006]|uniref:choice-of-anchor L domain-containing protein n=1 Tax=Lewinella sp. LCG006 TaxID=3231911 RepID=UPI003460728D